MNVVHDHFDGSYNCVDCDGPCKLEGAALWLTELVRWRFEINAHKGESFFGMERTTLLAAGVDIEAFMARAKNVDRPPLLQRRRKEAGRG